MSNLMLSGCADMNSQFDCPMKPGVRCESLDQINARVDRGELGSIAIPSYKKSDENEPYYSPVRSKEKVMHTWIAPYEDQYGNYHDGNDIYSVSQGSRWEKA